ncbi:MAG TPA: DUF4124 domain-containing protein [Usitatibacter sp.]|nr:DUF4124 domain-containing protein [Usitatibacter sp.]
MKRVLFVAMAVAFAPLAGAQLYKHVDKDGRVHYSDQPPANADAKALNIPKSAIGSSSGSKSYVAQDKEIDKKRKAEQEKQGKAGDAAKKEEEAAKRCDQARAAHQYFVDGGKIFKPGSRDLMTDSEIESERSRTRRDMDEACKGR